MLTFSSGPEEFAAPCHDCLITWMHATLEHADGTTANADTGLWLHHTLLVNLDAENTRGCGGDAGGRGERFFAAGNERSVIDLCRGG